MIQEGGQSVDCGLTGCFKLNADIMIEFQPIPECWECKLENRQTDPKYRIIWIVRDHWVVVCNSSPKDGSQGEEISCDFWEGRPPGEDPDDWFRKKYNNPDRGQKGVSPWIVD